MKKAIQVLKDEGLVIGGARGKGTFATDKNSSA